MFDIHCTTCDRDYIVSTASLTAFANAEGGPVGRATCPRDHEVVVDFRPRAHRPLAA